MKVEGISASWSYEREKMVLSNISMEVNKVSQWDYCINQSSLTPRPRGLGVRLLWLIQGMSALFLRPRGLGVSALFLRPRGLGMSALFLRPRGLGMSTLFLRPRGLGMSALFL